MRFINKFNYFLNSMKTKFYIVGMLVFLLLLSGCGYKIVKNNGNNTNVVNEQKTESDKNEIFAKKQECVSYQKSIEQKLKELDFTNENVALSNHLDEIWFSDSLNSCLYSYKTLWQYLGNNKGTSGSKIEFEYTIYDYLENKLLFNTSDGLIGRPAAIKAFDNRKDEFKK